MNEEQNVKVMMEGTKEVVKDAYADGIKPILKPTGDIVGMVPRAIKAALLPCEKWILNREYNLAETKKLLESKLADVDPKNIKSPEAYIAVPTLQYISYCMDNEELRNMYANLLASSMNTIIKNGVHPGFVEIIKQLSPDEAKILKFFSKEEMLPTITLRAKNDKEEWMNIISDFSNVGELANCEETLEIGVYIDNLIRLGLIEKGTGSNVLVNDELYKNLENHEYIKRAKQKIKELEVGYNKPEIRKSYIYLTSFGEQFCEICLRK